MKKGQAEIKYLFVAIEVAYIMSAVARLGDAKLGLYGNDPYEASRIDSFLDASLVFAREPQRNSSAINRRCCGRRSAPSNFSDCQSPNEERRPS